jgi:adenylate kinase family enzyme
MVIIFGDKEFIKNGKKQFGFYMERVLKHNLDNYIIGGVKRKFDGIVLITGLEGTGKSTFAKQIAAYCGAAFNHNLLLENIVFTGKDLMERIDQSPVGTPIIYDEAIMDMASQDSATDIQKVLIKKFTLIRKKRLFIFLVIPSLFMLRKYFAIFRTRVMLNCYCPDGITRGYFKAYSNAAKKELYLKGYKEMNMNAAKSSFRGRFTDTSNFLVDEEMYEHNKDEAIKMLTQEKTPDEIQKIKDQFEIYTIKLKQQVEAFKDKMKMKVAEEHLKYNEKARLGRIKEAEKYTNKYLSMEQNYYRVLAHLYKITSENYKLHTQKQLTEQKFCGILVAQNVLKLPVKTIKKDLEKGEGILKRIL